MQWHLAQINIGRLRAPVGDPVVAEFVAALEPVNLLAERSPGFVWRLQTEDGDATAIRPDSDDALLAVNMSVWTSVESLADYVYRSEHVAFLRRRRSWFQRLDQADHTMWWLPAGIVPTVEEGMSRIAALRAHGASPYAFTFRERFEPPQLGAPATADERDICPA